MKLDRGINSPHLAIELPKACELTISGNFVILGVMLKIRLQRVGRVHEPSFRLVLTDSKNSTKSGKYVESLGSFDSRRSEKAEFKDDRVKYWISKGAQTSGTVHNLLVSRKVIEGKKINVLPKKKPILKESTETGEKSVEKKEEIADTKSEVKEETIVDTEVDTETSPVEEVEKTAPVEEKVASPEVEATPEEASEENIVA